MPWLTYGRLGGRADGCRGHGSVEQRRDEEIGKTKVSKTLYNGDGGRGNASEPKAKRTAQNIPSPAHRLEAGHMGERGGEGG